MMPASPDIVYRHNEWMIIDKPAGFSVQQLAQQWSPLFTAFHPVHRLDKGTSGLWLIALTAAANRQLSVMFAEHTVYKAYLAITHKKPRKKQGKIIGDMRRGRRGQWLLETSREHPAITEFRSVGFKAGLRCVLCRPLTGKTHQIRVAMKSLGSPICGDQRYDGGNANDFDRLYLHAYALAFDWQGQRFQFVLSPNHGILFTDSALQGLLPRFQDLLELVA